MGCLFRLLFLLIVAAVVGVPGAAVLMGVERTPLLRHRAELRPAELRQAAMLAMRLGPAALQPGRQTTITLSEPELNLLIQGWTARVPRLAARAGVASIGVAVGATATLPVPENPLGRYVNIRALIVPSSTGLDVDRLSVGRLDVPSPLIRPLLVFLLNHVGAAGQGETLYSSVRALRVAGRRVSITLKVPQNLTTGLVGGGALPATGNPAAVEAEIRRRLADDPAAREQAIDALRQHGVSVPGNR